MPTNGSVSAAQASTRAPSDLRRVTPVPSGVGRADVPRTSSGATAFDGLLSAARSRESRQAEAVSARQDTARTRSSRASQSSSRQAEKAAKSSSQKAARESTRSQQARAERAERSDRADQAEPADRAGRAESADHLESARRTERQDQVDPISRGERADRAKAAENRDIQANEDQGGEAASDVLAPGPGEAAGEGAVDSEASPGEANELDDAADTLDPIGSDSDEDVVVDEGEVELDAAVLLAEAGTTTLTNTGGPVALALADGAVEAEGEATDSQAAQAPQVLAAAGRSAAAVAGAKSPSASANASETPGDDTSAGAVDETEPGAIEIDDLLSDEADAQTEGDDLLAARLLGRSALPTAAQTGAAASGNGAADPLAQAADEAAEPVSSFDAADPALTTRGTIDPPAEGKSAGVEGKAGAGVSAEAVESPALPEGSKVAAAVVTDGANSTDQTEVDRVVVDAPPRSGATQSVAPVRSAPPAPALPPEIEFARGNHERIVTGISGQLLPNGGTMSLKLDPPELGALQVQISVRDGVVTASFQTSNEAATKLLSHSLAQLKSGLESAGVSVDKLAVQQAPRDNDSSSSRDSGQRQQQGGFDQQASQQREEQRREIMRRMWQRISGDPVDLVA